jgi:hypothetical protein
LLAGEVLGARHATHGRNDADCKTTGASLLWTLKEEFESVFTFEIEDASAAAYSLLSKVTQSAAYRSQAAYRS